MIDNEIIKYGTRNDLTRLYQSKQYNNNIRNTNTEQDETNVEDKKTIIFFDDDIHFYEEMMLPLNTSKHGTIMPYNREISLFYEYKKYLIYYILQQNFRKICKKLADKELEECVIVFIGDMLEGLIQDKNVPINYFPLYSLHLIIQFLILARRKGALYKLLNGIGRVESKKCIDDFNLLLTAVNSGDLETLKMLLNFKPDVNKKDRDGHTALHVAAFKWNEDMLHTLIDHKADINIRDETQDTVLHIFLRGAYYLKDNLDVNQVKRVISLLTGNADLREIRNRMGETLLHEAVTSLQPEIVYVLIEEYALLPDVQDEQGWSLLHALVFKASDEVDINRVINTAATLLSLDVKADVCNYENMTPLQFAKYLEVEYLEDFFDTNGTHSD